MRKKHILIFNWKDIRHPKKGGAEVLTHEVAKRLAEKGYHVTLVASSFPHAKDHEMIDGVEVLRCGNRYTVYFRAYRLYKKQFRGRVDIVIDEINTIPFFTPWFVKERVFGFIHQMAKNIWWYEMPFPFSLIGFVFEPLYLRVYNNVPMLTVSESTKQDLKNIGIPENNISIISEGLTLPCLRSLDHMKKETEPTLLYLGSLRPMKRVLDVLKAFRLIHEKYPCTRLWVAGGGKPRYVRMLHQYIEKHGLTQSVTFFGPVTSHEKELLLARAHLLLTASVLEGWGLVVTEANALGTPAVSYNVGGLRDSTRHRITGLVCSDNPVSMAREVLALFSNPKEYERLRVNAWEWSKSLSWDITAEQVENIVNGVGLSAKARGTGEERGAFGDWRWVSSGVEDPLVSVIVPSFNAEQWIEKTMQSLQRQRYQNLEIIVVDNFSTDRTVEIAKKYTGHILLRGSERSAQVNFGALQARGKYLYRVDADFVVDSDVVFQCVATCEAEHLDGIAVHNTSDPTISFWSKVRNLERNCYTDDNHHIGLRFVSKKAFDNLHGFDEQLIAGEDYDFHNRFEKKGYSFGRIPAQEVHLGEPKTLREVMSKSYFYGKSLPQYVKKNSDRSLRQFNPLRTAYLRHWRSLLLHPFLSLGLVIYSVVKFTAGGLGYLSAFLNSKRQDRVEIESSI